ncbi:MAG: hypothetical protein EOO77_25180 [Oxalobacteraceae bacterium]|nr:MAG: hypothetical protein EOO77_25180 [Oxalobacteraceae bacterium]
MSSVQGHPDIIRRAARAVAAEGVLIAVLTLRRFFERHRHTRKKDRLCARAGLPQYAERARGLVRPLDLDPKMLIFVDEIEMTRWYGTRSS